MRIKFLMLLLFVLISCNPAEKGAEEQTSKSEVSITRIDSVTKIDKLSLKDTELQIRAKLKMMVKFENHILEEKKFYESFIKDSAYIFTIKDIEGLSYFNAFIYNDRLHYIDFLMVEVGNLTEENISQNYDSMMSALNGLIKNGQFIIVDEKYFTTVDNGETWFCTWILSINERTGIQQYWFLMSPPSDFGYLKYKVQGIFDTEGIKAKFLL